MRTKLLIYTLIFVFCSSQSASENTQQQNTSSNNSQPSQNEQQQNSNQQENENNKGISEGIKGLFSNYDFPDVSYFLENKSDQFLVDFEDIVAAHPYVGLRAPAPHNDLHVFFSNTDPRWAAAEKPSDYPPIYAVADGVVRMSQQSYYNVVDHSDQNPPWWHAAYAFKLQIAENEGRQVSFLYQMEPYTIPENEDFFKDFLLVEDGQEVKKGDVLGYMYVPTFEEMVGSDGTSAHIAFGILEKVSDSKEQEKVPSIFTENIVQQFAEIMATPTEGWGSTSYGNDWSRGRGLPYLLGWMIGPEEHLFGGQYLDAVAMGDESDSTLSSQATLLPETLGLLTDNYVYKNSGSGNAELNITFPENQKFDFVVATVGSPVSMKFRFKESNGTERESQFMSKNQGLGFLIQYYQNFGFSNEATLIIEDPQGWGWAIAFALSGVDSEVSGTTRTEQPYCPPGCPPSPNPYKLKSDG